MEKLSEKIKEALSSTLPINCIVLALSIFVVAGAAGRTVRHANVHKFVDIFLSKSHIAFAIGM